LELHNVESLVMHSILKTFDCSRKALARLAKRLSVYHIYSLKSKLFLSDFRNMIPSASLGSSNIRLMDFSAKPHNLEKLMSNEIYFSRQQTRGPEMWRTALLCVAGV
jgi:hypothetical protein